MTAIPPETYRVLLIEDDAADAAQLRLALSIRSGASFELEIRRSLAELESALSEIRPDVIALDLSLPDSSGADTYARARQLAPDQAIVVLTGQDDNELALNLIHAGAQDYLVKSETSRQNIVRCLQYAIERKRTEAEAERARLAAQAASRAKSEFVAALSHEIRNPLNAILGMADLLLETPLALDQREYVRVFRRCGHSLLGLLDNVLEISRVEAGRIELEIDDLDLTELIQESIETFAFDAHRKGIALLTDLEDAPPPPVRCDVKRLRQVLLNLVGNAIKFTDEGQIVVRCRTATSETDPGAVEVRIAVEDSGVGIPPDRVARVFDRFVQADPSVRREHGGSGLGLALCRDLIECMGGEITLESAPGEGSRFEVSVVLPRSAAAAAAGERPDLSGRRLLLVVQNASERGLLLRSLRAHGAEVVERGSAAAVRAIAARHGKQALDFDGVVVDCRMKQEGGLELAEWLRAAAGDRMQIVPLLPLGHRTGDLALCKALGAQPLLKPVRPAALLALLSGDAPPAPAQPVGDVVEDPDVAERQAAIPPDRPFEDLRILVADDDPDNRTLVDAYLKRTGAQVVPVADGAAAVDRAREGRWNLLLVDVQMPGMDGVEVARRIRRQEASETAGPEARPRLPIVALTGSSEPEDERRCLDAGCDARALKPFSRSELIDVVARYARRGFAHASGDPDDAQPVSDFLVQLSGSLSRLREAVASADYGSVRRIGHAMIETGSTLGLDRIHELGVALERAGKDTDAPETERITQALEDHLGGLQIPSG